MAKKKRQILAIGGGGFGRCITFESQNLLLESYFIQQTGIKSPRVCFIPTASGEDQKYIINFYRAFNALHCKTTHLSLFEPPTADLESFILDHDAIYVGGGNTKSMLALWREWKIDLYLKKAWQAGIVLGGVSAGSICWFEEGVTDSIPGSLTPLPCLGFLKGSNCPHYDSEKMRRPSFHKLIKLGMLPGIAADDNVVAHFIGTTCAHIMRANDTGSAYFVSQQKGKVIERQIVGQEIIF
jgi:dipeptidase E